MVWTKERQPQTGTTARTVDTNVTRSDGPKSVKEWLGSTETPSAWPTEERKGENTGKGKGSPSTHSSANSWLEQEDQPQGQGKQGQSKGKDHMTGGGKGSDMYPQHSNQVLEWNDVGPTRLERTEMLMGNSPRGTQARVMKLWAKDKLVALGIQDWVSHYQPMYARGENMLIGFYHTDSMFKALSIVREAQL